MWCPTPRRPSEPRDRPIAHPTAVQAPTPADVVEGDWAKVAGGRVPAGPTPHVFVWRIFKWTPTTDPPGDDFMN